MGDKIVGNINLVRKSLLKRQETHTMAQNPHICPGVMSLYVVTVRVRACVCGVGWGVHRERESVCVCVCVCVRV